MDHRENYDAIAATDCARFGDRLGQFRDITKLQELIYSGAAVAELTRRLPRDVGWVGRAERGRGTERKRRTRRPTLAAALKQANKAGVDVKGATLAADGSVSLMFGKPSTATVNENEWDLDIYGEDKTPTRQ